MLSEISIYHTYSSNSFYVIYRRYNLKWRQCNIGWHSKQSIWHWIVKVNLRAQFFQDLSKKFLKSSNSIRFLSASCKFWLHWSLSPYKRKYAEYFAFWILEALQKTNTPNFHKFKANYLSKRGLKWLTQILSWFSPKNEGSVAPISIRK